VSSSTGWLPQSSYSALSGRIFERNGIHPSGANRPRP
jgi:hypothetical protein